MTTQRQEPPTVQGQEPSTAQGKDPTTTQGQHPPGSPPGPPYVDTETLSTILQKHLEPWRQALADPAKAQEAVLRRYLRDFARTEYGRSHSACELAETSTSGASLIDAYRQAFPIMTYEDYKPLIYAVMSGETELLLSEEPVGWAITRGTVQGESKFIPMTPADLRLRTSAGRAMVAYVASTRRFDLLSGVNLNLNFPSTVGTVRVGDREISYGYSSGIYTRHLAQTTPIKSLPTQEEIDALGGATTRALWHARFELALERCRGQNVTLVGGVCQTALEFGRYLRKHHGVYPKDLWKVQVMTLGSTPAINTRHAPTLRALYGPVAIREIYGATEGMFGQQADEHRAWVPNYDLYFFEVLTRSGIKMLHEMKPGERGSLVVTTPILARYRIGDLILALRPPYFRCIGREKWWTALDYYWRELTSLNLGRL